MSSKFLNANTDVNLSANSDSQIPSQKAVKTYVDNKTSVLATKAELTEYLKTTDAQNTYSKVGNTVSDVVAGSSANQINVTKGGSTKTITINNVANATTATKASQDINGRSIVNGYISTDFGGSVRGTDVRVQANYYGTVARPKNYFRNVNLLHTVKNNFYRADKNLYNKGTVTVTCSYDDVVSGLGVSMLNGSADGYYPSINPSTMFSDKPFVWEILSSVSFEVTDVCNLFITGHRLGSTGLFTKYKLEVTNAYNSGNPTWYTLVDYEGDAVELGNKHFGLYSSEISTSPAYHSVYGVRLTISGSTSTVFQMSQIMLLCSRGTENVSDGVHALDVGKGGTVVGNITIPTQHGSFIGNLNGTASKATADASGNTITTTYATKNELNTGLSSKQGTLTAGTGIRITDSTISNAFTSLDSYTTFSEAALKENSSFIYRNTDGAYLRGNFINFVNSIIKPSFATKDDLSTKQNTISDLDTIRSGAALGSTALQSVPEEYITESELAAKNYATTTDLNTGLSTKQDTISDLSTIREGAALGATALQSYTETDPTVPAHVKAITTANISSWNAKQPAGDYATKTEVEAKQDKLIAGTNITIENNVLSATGSGFDFEGTKAEFDAAVAAGTITEDSVSLITDDVYGANVATKAELQTVYRNKADTNLSNTAPSTNFKHIMFVSSLPDTVNGYITISADASYTVPDDGWVWTQGYFTGARGQTITASLNGVSLPSIGYNNSSTYNFDSPQWFPVSKGDVWICNRESRFYGLRG